MTSRPTEVQRVEYTFPAYSKSPPKTTTKVLKWSLAFFAVAGGIGFIIAIITTGALPVVTQSIACVAPAAFGVLSTAGFAFFVYRDDKRSGYQKALREAIKNDKMLFPNLSDDESNVERMAKTRKKKRTSSRKGDRKKRKSLPMLQSRDLETEWHEVRGARTIDFTNNGEAFVPNQPEALPITSLPHFGQYDHAAYVPKLIVKLPKGHIQKFGFSRQIKKRLLSMKTDVYFIVYQNSGGVIYADDYRNLSYHAMVFPDAKIGQKIQPKNVEMVMGDTIGITPSKRQIQEPKRGGGSRRVMPGISFDEFGAQRVHVHHPRYKNSQGKLCEDTSVPMALSPHRAEFKIDSDQSTNAFFSAAVTNANQKEAVAVFGVVINNDMNDTTGSAIAGNLKYGDNILELCEAVRDADKSEGEKSLASTLEKALNISEVPRDLRNSDSGEED